MAFNAKLKMGISQFDTETILNDELTLLKVTNDLEELHLEVSYLPVRKNMMHQHHPAITGLTATLFLQPMVVRIKKCIMDRILKS